MQAAEVLSFDLAPLVAFNLSRDVRNFMNTRCFSLSLVSCLGARAVTIVFGSAMGGLLVQPADHYPSVFSATGLFGM